MKFEALDQEGRWRCVESEKEQLRKHLDKNAVCLRMKRKRQSKRGQQRATEGVSGHPQQVREFGL